MKERDWAKQIGKGQPEMKPTYRKLHNCVKKRFMLSLKIIIVGLSKKTIKIRMNEEKVSEVLDKNTNSDIPSSLEFEGKCLTRKQARNRSQIFGGARFGNSCYSSIKKRRHHSRR